jgi:hypothetical protein
MQRLPHRTAHFDEESAYTHFTEVVRLYLRDDDFLESVGIGLSAAALDSGVSTILRDAGRRHWRRSAIFAFADELQRDGESHDAIRLRQVASVVYMAHFGGLFGQVCLFPRWYEPYLSIMTAVPMTKATSGSAKIVTELRALLPNTRKDDLAQLSVEDLYRLRNTKAFATYRTALDEGGSANAFDDVLTALAGYLMIVDEYVAERQSAVRPRTTAARVSLGLIKRATDAGVVVSVADVATGGQYTPGVLPDAAIVGSGLVFLVLGHVVARRLGSLEEQRRRYWNDYCGADGTFSAQIARIRERHTDP